MTIMTMMAMMMVLLVPLVLSLQSEDPTPQDGWEKLNKKLTFFETVNFMVFGTKLKNRKNGKLNKKVHFFCSVSRFFNFSILSQNGQN